MDICLLCLEMRNNLEGGIHANATQWLEQDIEQILQKHFWPLKSISTNAWLCAPCWQILNEFHQFYKRIEDAHAYFSSLLKTEMHEYKEHEDNNVTSNILKATSTLRHMPFEGEIPIDQNFHKIYSKGIGGEPFIKIETNNVDIIAEKEHIVHTRRKSKRGDPLEKKSTKTTNKLPGDNNQVNLSEEVAIQPVTNDIFESQTDSDGCSDNDDMFGSDDLESQPNASVSARHQEHDEFVAKNFQLKCGICQASMNTFQDVCKHSAEIHNHRGYVMCCNKKFFKRIILVEHIHWHLDPQYFKCRDCGKVLADRRCLEVHARVHKQLERSHMCDVCGKGFALPRALNRHKLTHMPNEERKFQCSQCPKRFGHNDLLVEHTRSVHFTKYAVICFICGKGLRTQAVFKQHMLKHESVPQPTFNCDVCGLKLANVHRLKSHKETKHAVGEKKEYKCHLCPKISPSPRALKAHVQYKHELGYDFKCTICDKAFKRSLSLKEHVATHTGTVLYTCPYCPKTFNSNANMHSHRKKMHHKKWEEAHRAKFCEILPTN